ncbi:uncharacterized protein LOC128116643 isoform X3 [Peromyscus californicus insignis]|uniref:uncharacterized protein LOC128116643 isoform X3 n=1 Tax=Peromyscus californicus insignis TaxID=564181 RepID=UPI0022A75BD3|nr:uncharacterized protein LOC128116643 isoform X3 [Peromyscus californicus insignis]
MGNPASRLGCLGERRSRSHTNPRTHTSSRTRGGDLSPAAAPQGPLPPGIPWAWWGSRAVQVTEVTETVVTETVVTEAVEMGPCRQRRQPAQATLAPLDTLCSWLDGMEELQASQGPLAADAALAASQLREQELLLRLLRERAPHMEPRLQEAGRPAELCTQWHRLVQQAETRWRLLGQLVPAAERFETACKALLGKLGPSEQLLAGLQLGPECPEESLQYFQEVCEGLVVCTEDLERVLETGQRLAELLTSDQAQLVQQRLDQFQERVRLTESQVTQQKLLYAQRTVSSKSSPPAVLEAQLELEGSASAHPGLKDQKQLSVQLAQLAERLEQLAQWAEASSHTAVPTVTIWDQSPSSAVLQADTKPLEGHWLETREQDPGLKAVWEPAVQILCGLTEQAAIEELRPEGDWNPALQEFLWGQQTLVVSWLRRSGDAAHGSTCHLGLLMDLLGCRAAVSSPSCERIHPLGGMLLLVGHLVEKLVSCSCRVSQAEPLGAKVVQAQSWVLEELPGALSLKCCWTQAPREVLALRSLDQGPPGDLGNRDKACLLGKISEEQSWRPWWADVIMENWSHRKPEHSKRNQEKRDQWVLMEQGHQEQDLVDSFLAAGHRDRDGQGWPGYTWGKCDHKRPTVLEPGLPNGQKHPHSMVGARNTEGTSIPVARGRPKVQGGLAARGALMVRVGGGWAALDEFLVKNDPVRATWDL